MPASSGRLFWTAVVSTVVALLIDHVVWFLVRSQPLVGAVKFVYVPVLIGLVAGLIAGALAVVGARITRGGPALVRYVVVTLLAVLGATLGTFLFPAMFLLKWFTVPVLALALVVGLLLFARDRDTK